MEDSIFTRIIKGEVPGEIVYQDGVCVVMMTIEPITPGHCMVIPRQQIDHLWDFDSDTYRHLMDVAKEMATRIRGAYSYERIGMFVEGFGVPHAHVHVFGYEQPLAPTMAEHAAHKVTVVGDELRNEADKLRQNAN